MSSAMTIEEKIAQGLAAYGRGEMAEAGQYFRSVLAAAPHHSDALNLYGAVCLAEGRFEEAIAVIQQALGHYPAQLPPAGRVVLLNNLGNGYQSMGLFDRAETAYRQAIDLQPQTAELWNNLGNLLAKSSVPARIAAAAEAYQNALRFQPHFPSAAANYAYFLLTQNRYQSAIAAFAVAIEQNPNSAPEFRASLAKCHRYLGDVQTAKTILATAVAELIASHRRAPHVYRAYGLILQETAQTRDHLTEGLQWILRGLIGTARDIHPLDLLDLSLGQANLGDWTAARATVAEVLSQAPNSSEAIFMRARLSEMQYDYAAAIADYKMILSADESLHSARLNLGNCLVAEARGAAGSKVGDDQLAEAKIQFEKLLAADGLPPSDTIAARLGLASAQHFSGDSEAALQSLERAQNLVPHHPLVLYNRANILQDSQDFAAAIEGFESILSLYPDYHDARWNLAFAQLLTGDYPGGFKNFEVRWSRPSGRAGLRQFEQTLWLGGLSLEGKCLLVHAEQGLGDSLQFCRYLPMLFDLGIARVIFEVQPPLFELMTESFAHLGSRLEVVARVPSYPRGEGLPPFDAHIPLMSLPLVFGTGVTTVPATIPYLGVTAERADHWREQIDGLAGKARRIGLVWAGECRRDIPLAVETDRLRSIALTEFRPWLQRMAAEGTRVVSLQLGPARSQLTESELAAQMIDPMAGVKNFADTVAILMALDGLVSVDTSVAHAAGGLGVPVTLLSRHRGCWRWLAGREDSPWYPGLRVIHQARPMDWREEIAGI
ncbi:MAG: tetratricopeptide repeat protein [Candidatus Pacebacteria bacterium]|nr:tetratricopeptide repeat protein [Candidatus Paceibacterota bacterium]